MDFIGSVKKAYAFDKWPKKTANTRVVKQFAVNMDGLSGYELVYREAIPDAKHAYESIYRHMQDKNKRVQVRIIPAESYENAKEQLALTLAMCAAPQLPRLPENSAEAGDIGFGAADESQGTAMFVRGNMVVEIASIGLEDVDVTPVAVMINQQLAMEMSE